MTLANGLNIDRYLNQMGRIASEISREAVDAAIEILFDAWRHGNTVFVMGNGGSASTATHLLVFPADCVELHSGEAAELLPLSWVS